MTQPQLDEPPWDPGLQNERTRLAWQRTTLSGLTCSLLVTRLVAELSLGLALAVGLAALVSSVILGVYSSKRYVANHVALHANGPTSDARSQLVVTALVAVTAVAAAGYVLTK